MNNDMFQFVADLVGTLLVCLCSVYVAIYTAKKARQNELEIAASTLLSMISQNYSTISCIKKEIIKAKNGTGSTAEKAKLYVEIIQREEYLIPEIKEQWALSSGHLYLMLCEKRDGIHTFDSLRRLALLLDQFASFQKNRQVIEQKLANDVECEWIKKQYKNLQDLVNEIKDEQIKQKFFRRKKSLTKRA